MVANNCTKCGKSITDSEYEYSKDHYGKALCKRCQKSEKGTKEEESEEVIEEEVVSDAGGHDVYIDVPFRTRMLGAIIAGLSLVGLFRGFLKFLTEPPQTFAFYFFPTSWLSVTHIISQVVFFIILVLSFYLIFKHQGEPRVIWGG